MNKENSKTNLFQAAFDKVAVGVAQLTPEGRFIKLNNKFCEIAGYNKEELLEITFRDITHPDDLQLDEENIAEVLTGKKDAFEIEKRYIHKNGEIIAYYDTDLRIIWSNRASAESVGLLAKDLIGKHCYEVWNNRKTPCEGCPVLKARETKKPVKSEQQTPDGKHWYLRGYPVLDNKDNVIALVEFGQDITDRKTTEAELEKHRKHLQEMVQDRTSELEEKNKELERFNKLFVGREFRIKELY